MGRDKAFLPHGPTTWIAHQVALLRAVGCAEVLISGRPATDYGVPDARLVFDPVAQAGPLAGLVAVLAAAQHPWVLVIAVDLPLLTPEFLQSLITASAGQIGIVPQTPHGPEPLAALYPRALLPHAEAALHTGRLALHALVTEAETLGLLRRLTLTPHESTAQKSLHALKNHNTPRDLHVT
jgi:molybdenum cofactor guanylyltransferase